MSDALSLDDVTRHFDQGPRRVEVLTGASMNVAAGEVVALVAPSGAGKSTLLQIAGLLDTPNSGTVAIEGRVYSGLDDQTRTAARRRLLGFVYQFHHLLPEFSARENLAIPLMTAGASERGAMKRADELLARVGLAERGSHRPAELSGGEQQRVAICRALANRPRVLLADEPTGNLDPETASRVFDMLLEVVRETGLAALIATHNHDLASRMDRTVRLEGGVVAS
ncbi:MAG: ABC transporter ATP-binding protein [Paracoccaceae bacterium]|nr:ABC transporter ATP-binding protein [Paracoccaceae bacterium]